MNVLFLGGAKRVSIGRMLIDAARGLGHEMKIFSAELCEDVPIAAIGTPLVAPRWRDAALIPWLEETVASRDIKVIIPFVDPAVEVAAAFRDTHPGVFAPVGDIELVRTMFDKVEAADFFYVVGVPTPATLTLADDRYPKIAKPRRGSASQGIKIINGPGDVAAIDDPDQYLIQEYIGCREEYTVDCYVTLAGEIICAVPRLRLETAGGEVTRSVTVDIAPLTRLAYDTLRLTGLRGAVTLQFIRDLDRDRWLLMEINPRLGGGAVTAVHAGADIPSYIFRDALGLPIDAPRWKPGVEIARYMQEVVFRNIKY